ncbi:ferredoxin [Streptomyces avermitilis]|uniref:ferredoxin n=1 Tax=Streptomyces avermitilis TaxID=33903 RepID=UPI0033F131E3
MNGSNHGNGDDTVIAIDRDLCIGAGQCALTAPGVFTQDDDGFSELLPGREDGAGDPMVREAARSCPVGAITVPQPGS